MSAVTTTVTSGTVVSSHFQERHIAPQHFDLLPECSVHLQMAFAFTADANSEFQVHAAANGKASSQSVVH